MAATAFVLAAGLGTRLRPLTLEVPKPLLPVGGRPLLDHVVAHARTHGHHEIVVNAFWLADQIVAWAEGKAGVKVVVEAPLVLGTGGGLRNARDLLADRFVVLNGDVLSDVDLTALWALPTPAAMAVRSQPIPARGAPAHTPVAVRTGRVTGIEGVAGEARGDWHFTGIHVMDRALLDLVPPEGEACVIRTVYRQLVPEGRVGALIHGGRWCDIGTLAEYERVRAGGGPQA